MRKKTALLGLLLAASLCSCGIPDREGARLTENAGEGVTIRITRSGGERRPTTTIEVSPGGLDGEIVLHIDLDE